MMLLRLKIQIYIHKHTVTDYEHFMNTLIHSYFTVNSCFTKAGLFGLRVNCNPIEKLLSLFAVE